MSSTDPLLLAFLEATGGRFRGDRARRAAVMVGVRDKLLAACRKGIAYEQSATTVVSVRLPIDDQDTVYFTELATRIDQVMDFPQDDRVALTASVHRQQHCAAGCEVERGECGCPWEHHMSVMLTRLLE